ncbi:MAG: 3-isopropylmalate dehydratase small subunit [Thermoleophilia bacterium]
MIDGAAWILGDNVSTDEILPGRYMGLTDLAALGRHALEGVVPGLPARIAPGDVLVGGRNFGTGSSREQAPVALREAGFGAIVAASFARIFFRNCLNVGLPVLWSPTAAAEAREGDRLLIDPASGTIRNVTRGTEHVVPPLPAFAQAIVAGGGLMPYARARLGRTLVPRAGES